MRLLANLTLMGTMAWVALMVAGCNRASSGGNTSDGNSAEAAENVPTGAARVETVEVEEKDLVQTIELPGTVEGIETADLYAKVGGYLEEIHVDIGDRVEKDQVLARIHVPEMVKELDQKRAGIAHAEAMTQQATAAVRQAEAQVAAAVASLDESQTERQEKQALRQYREAEYQRVKGLVESGALLSGRLDEVRFQLDAAEAVLRSVEARIRTAEANRSVAEADLDKAKADRLGAGTRVDMAKADFERTETMLQYAVIRAPFDSVVTKRWVHPGAFIQPAEGNSAAGPLLTVTRTDQVRILLDLPMAEVGLLDRGDRAVLQRINVSPDMVFEGTVTRFSGALETASRMMRVEVQLPNAVLSHTEGRLLPGSYGYVTLFLEEFPQTPVIPSSALMRDAAGWYVYVVRRGICHKRVVRVNYQDGSIVGIASGLAPGERVVRAGGGQLTEGQAVVTTGIGVDGYNK